MESTRQIVVVVFIRGDGHRFLWRFFADELLQSLRRVGRQAADASSPLTWQDAAIVCNRMREEVYG